MPKMDYSSNGSLMVGFYVRMHKNHELFCKERERRIALGKKCASLNAKLKARK